jgi:hypothetical protein
MGKQRRKDLNSPVIHSSHKPMSSQDRKSLLKQLQIDFEAVYEAYSLMNYLKVPESMHTVPAWLMPIGTWMAKFKITAKGFPQEHKALYEAVAKAILVGDFKELEIWCMVHEDD